MKLAKVLIDTAMNSERSKFTEKSQTLIAEAWKIWEADETKQ